MPARDMIPVYEPDLSGNEKPYVLECLDTGWISSRGEFVGRFEKAFAERIGARHAISVGNGTVALHLALHCLGIGPGDEVIVPTFTYIASVNTIAQTGAKPVFVECRREDWLVDPDAIEAAMTPRTKAVMPVHLYGAVCDMTRIGDIAARHRIKVIEDCAESLGAFFGDSQPGMFGDIGAFSFFGNKTVTTGEGGMVVTNDDDLASRLRRVRSQGESPTRRYWHVELGFNYRMTNICAAIGLAQMERIDQFLERKRYLARFYREKLAASGVEFQRPHASVKSSEWLISLLLPREVDQEAVMQRMKERGVETRPVFHCAHKMPMYEGPGPFPISEEISRRGICIPSYPGLTDAEIDKVVASLQEAIKAGTGPAN